MKYNGMMDITREEIEEMADADKEFSFSQKQKVRSGGFLLREPKNRKKKGKTHGNERHHFRTLERNGE